MSIEIVLPERSDDLTSDGLRRITAAIEAKTGDCGFGIGGASGYGAPWDSDVFTMRRFYWGDCDCGFEERSERWHKAHPHQSDCFQVELHRRFAAYDADLGIEELEAAMRSDDAMEHHVEENDFGLVSWSERTPWGEATRRALSEAFKEQMAAHEEITDTLYIERGLPPSAFQWLCTCGVDDLARTYFAKEGHYPTCSLELPNFLHKRTGFEVRWYKWIGRDNEYRGECIWPEVLAECLADIASTPSSPKGSEDGRTESHE